MLFWQPATKHVPMLGEVTEHCYSETNGRRKGHHQKNSVQTEYQVNKKEISSILNWYLQQSSTLWFVSKLKHDILAGF